MSNWLLFPHSEPRSFVHLLFRTHFLIFCFSLCELNFILLFPSTSPPSILISHAFTSILMSLSQISVFELFFGTFVVVVFFSSLFVSVLLRPAVCLSCAFSELGCSLQIWRLKPSWKSRSLSWKSPVWNVSIWLFRSSSTQSDSAPTRYCSTPAWPRGEGLLVRGSHYTWDKQTGLSVKSTEGESEVECVSVSCDPLGPPRLPCALALLSCVGVLWRSCDKEMSGEFHSPVICGLKGTSQGCCNILSVSVVKGQHENVRAWGPVTPSLKFMHKMLA